LALQNFGQSPLIRELGRVAYEPTWQAMQRLTDQRDPDTPDELWVLEHEPIFTLGMNADTSHLLEPGAIPVLKVDRGGQVTYHGPGQLVLYPLIDLRRAALGVRQLITILEQSVIACLAHYAITATTRPSAPGVYVDEAKIASLGIRVRRGASYHGLSLNINMDLEPFSRINPCGYAGLAMTQVASLGGPDRVSDVAAVLIPEILRRLQEEIT
jgi:lipoyl(octanoyl) transferase